MSYINKSQRHLDFDSMQHTDQILWEIENKATTKGIHFTNWELIEHFLKLLDITPDSSGEFIFQGSQIYPEKIVQRIMATSANIYKYKLPFSEKLLRHSVNEMRDINVLVARNKFLESINSSQLENDPKVEIDKLYHVGFEPRHQNIAIPVLLNFMWQVKRKMQKIPVTNHLMPILFGGQGSGKSYFVRLMTEPLRPFSVDADFTMIQDDRYISLWENYIFFLDEMQHASKSDWAVIKNRITKPSLDMRPLYSTNLTKVANNATFIGTSNDIGLEQSITDSTGNRRFIGLNVLPKMDWDTINSIDFLTIWKSVDPTSTDPIDAYNVRNDIIKEQTDSKFMSPVEHWLSTEQVLLNWESSNSAYELYKIWSCRYGTERNFHDVISFGKEMKRIHSHTPNFLMTKRDGKKGVMYKKLPTPSAQHSL